MEVINEIWAAIAPYVTGVSISGVLGAVIYGCLKGAFNKTISKINIEKISETATEKGIDKIKNISFTQSIQPLVESELTKITEKANECIKKELESVQSKYDNLLNVLEKLSAYFDNSIGVSETAKAELKQALSKAENKPLTAQEIKVEEVIEEKDTAVPKANETVKTQAKVIR